jgi:L-aspartate oxidase
MLKTDVLVIGCGLAGATASLKLAKKGRQVLLVTNSDNLEESNTFYAQGGIIYKGKNDPQSLMADIKKAGDGLCFEPAVKLLADLGPKLVEDFLIKVLGISFAKKDGQLHLTKEAAHNEPRIIHVQDKTGEIIQKALIAKLRKNPRIKILTGHTLIDLLTIPHHSKNLLDIYKKPLCVGAYIMDKKGKVHKIISGKTILATGGVGQVYQRTVNSILARGDGLAAAFRAGAKTLNCEYIQFHPTSLYHTQKDNFLITEALRGEGAKLKDAKGRLFMKKYHPLADLAPRDIVCRAIYTTMMGTDTNFVYLDAVSYIPPKRLKNQFATIYKTCMEVGIDITKDPIPVAPSAHYLCGGVQTDLWARTTLENLYAVGEVACTGLHGANRLASTSLLECLVYGARVAEDIANCQDKNNLDPGNIKDWQPALGREPDPALIANDWQIIKSTMSNYVGIKRSQEGLQRAVADLSYWQHRIEQFYRQSKLTAELVGLRNGIQTALIISQSSLQNKISRGCHWRVD